MTARASSFIVVVFWLLSGCGSAVGTIGAILGQRTDGRLFIREVPDGLAAADEGLRAGDEILLIDGIDVRTLDGNAVHELLSGDVGAPVRLTLIRKDEVVRVTLKRSQARHHPI